MSIADQVKVIIGDLLSIDTDEIKLECSIVDDLGIDRLAIVELILTIEEKFGITIPDEEAEKMKTVKDIIDYIEHHKSK